MATLLENYYIYKNNFDIGSQAAMPGPDQVWQQQELLYRIGVLETCFMFVKTAPRSTSANELLWHYRMMDAYFQSLTTERRYSYDVGGDVKAQRETAHGNLLQVMQDYRGRFGSFAPGTDIECYRKMISKVVQTVLPAWVQYRQTYIEIMREVA